MVNLQHILSIIIWVPIIVGLLILIINNKYLSFLAVLVGIFNFLFSLLLLKNFDLIKHGWQFVEHYNWFPELGVYYSLGVDGFATLLIVLTCLLNLLVLIIVEYNKIAIQRYMACFLIMTGLMCGVFSATNAILFYVFFEAMLIPLFLIIGLWGGTDRIYATLKFFLYTCVGSMLFLIAIIYIHKLAIASGVKVEDAFSIVEFYKLKLNMQQQIWLFVAFFIAFAIKIPMLPFHTWLPDAHVAAPTGGSVMLAGITLKIGAFAMLRFLLPIVSDACLLLSKFVIGMSLIAIVYVGFIAITQKDLKKLVAYSSIAHMGFVTIGMFIALVLIKRQDVSQAITSMHGSLMQMLSHGLTSAALFFSVGVLFERMNSHNIENFKGIVQPMPIFASLFMIFCLANVALPGTSGFVGEMLIILSSFKYSWAVAATAATSVILSVSYTLLAYNRIVFNTSGIYVNSLPDLNYKEILVLGTIAILIIIIGIWPTPIFNVLNVFTIDLIKTISGVQLVI